MEGKSRMLSALLIFRHPPQPFAIRVSGRLGGFYPFSFTYG